MMSHRTQLARWLHKQLVLKYTFASLVNPFETRYSTIKRDSGLLDAYARPRDAIEALEEAFEELKGQQVLSSVTRRDITGLRGKLQDVIFTLVPSIAFIGDTKAASKRSGRRHDREWYPKAVGLGRVWRRKPVGIGRGSWPFGRYRSRVLFLTRLFSTSYPESCASYPFILLRTNLL